MGKLETLQLHLTDIQQSKYLEQESPTTATLSKRRHFRSNRNEINKLSLKEQIKKQLKLAVHKLRRTQNKTQKQKLIIEGHRGVGKLQYENTLRGFQHAIDLGIDGVELDIWKSLDGVVYVIHGGPEGQVKTDNGIQILTNLTAEYINTIKLPSGDAIPTLEQVYQLFTNSYLRINVELKNADPQLSFLAMQLTQKYNLFTQVHFSSFQHICQQQLVAAKKQLGIRNWRFEFGFLADTQAQLPDLQKIQTKGNSLNISWELCQSNKQTVQSAKQKGMKIAMYFSFAQEENFQKYQQLEAMRVDKVITNVPHLLQEYVIQKCL